MDLIFIFILGLTLGSFTNVVIYRIDEWQSILNTRSHCRECKNNLAWYDLIPLVSFVTLRGKCRHCLKPIAWQYPLVELIYALLLMSTYAMLNFYNIPLASIIVALVFFAVCLTAMFVIFFHDLREMLIPESMLYTLLVAGLVFGAIYNGTVLQSIYGALAAAAPIALLVYPSRGKWMGEGDVWLAAGLGAMVGYPYSFAMLLISFMMGGLIGAVLLATKKKSAKSAVPFGPFLILGAILALYYGELITNWYLNLY